MSELSTPVIEVHKDNDGTWEAYERHILSSDDLETVDNLEKHPTISALVRVGGSLKQLTVYLEDEEDGWITWTDAYDLV